MPNGMAFASGSLITIFGTISFIVSLFVFGFNKRELKNISKLLFLAVLYILKYQTIFIKNLSVSIFKLLFFRMRKKNKDIKNVEKSGFFIKRQISDFDTKTLIEPDIKNLNISKPDFYTPENIKIDNNEELENRDSLRSKISQAVKNRNLKTINDADIQIDEKDGLLEDFQDEMNFLSIC